MEKAGITTGKFIAGIVIAILVSSAISAAISMRLIAGPQGPTGGLNAPNYDSGWVDISSKTGKYFNITHSLNSADVIVDIRGKTTADDGANQRYIGLISKPLWTRTYGGTGDEYANSIVQTSDGGYALAGDTYSFGEIEDFWLVKTDAAGNMQWNKTYGGTSLDYANSIVQTSDGGYALAGVTESDAWGDDFWLVKTDSAGTMQWNKTYGGTGDDRAESLIQTSDGGYALGGRTSSFGAGTYDFWLVKTDAAGNMQWNKTYGGTNLDFVSSVVQTLDGGYALAGSTMASIDADSSDFWLVKTDSAGNQLWNETYGGAGYDGCSSMVQTLDGGYALAGGTGSFSDGLVDFWLVKTDSAGTAQWNKTYGGTGRDNAYSLLQTLDGGYALAGATGPSGAWGAEDIWLVKTGSVGNMQWNKTYGATRSEFAYDIVQTSDGGYAIAGYTGSYGAGGDDFWLVRTEVESGLAWTDSTVNTITLYRGATDVNWNYVRVRIWKID